MQLMDYNVLENRIENLKYTRAGLSFLTLCEIKIYSSITRFSQITL